MGHRLKYGVYSLLLDLEEIGDVCRSIPIMSRNRFNLISIHDRDFGPRDGTDLRSWFESKAADAGVSIDGGSVSLLAFPRILGYAFNPITVWFGHGPDGSLRAVIYEVHNTFGQAQTYVAAVPRHVADDCDQSIPRHSFDKVFHVSPFLDVEGGYRMTLAPPQARYSIVIEYFGSDGSRILTASQIGHRQPLTTWTLLKQFFTKPLLTLKVIGGIHLEAVKLWRKGARYRTVPEPPADGVQIAQWEVDQRSISKAG